MRRDGSGFRRGPAEGFPRPSPDGKQLLIERGENWDDSLWDFVAHAVYVRDVATGSERRLTPPGGYERASGWSPDGLRVLITRNDRARGETTAFTIRPDGSDAKVIGSSAKYVSAKYLRSGAIAIDRSPRYGRDIVSVVPAEGGAERRLTPMGSWHVLDGPPSGDRLLLLRDAGDESTLWTARVDGSRLSKLADGGYGTWSPDGSSIAYNAPEFTGARGLYVIGADGRGRRRLLAEGWNPAWSPDGKTIAFDWEGECNGSGVYLIAASGGTPRRLTNGCRVVGTPRADVLLGSSERDVIRGFGGDDVIRANPGDRPPAYYGRVDHDDVDGGTGNDVIYGGRGLDVLRGGGGRDRIYGGRGADRIVGGPGADVIDAGPYHDRIRADDGTRDVVRCGEGTDRVVADRADKLVDCERVTFAG